MKLYETILEDYLRHTYRVKDPNILNSVKRVLSAEEQGSVELHATVVSQKKLVVVCEHPEQLEEVILIRKRYPRRVYRSRLALDRKNNARKA